MHGLHVSPDLDSVTYWLGDVFDRERGWGRRDETFRATEELRAFDAGAGVVRPRRPRPRDPPVPDEPPGGAASTLSEATAAVARRFGVVPRLLPMSDDPVDTRIAVVVRAARSSTSTSRSTGCGGGRRDEVKAVRYEGADTVRDPRPACSRRSSAADAVVLCPSNPVVSIGPILAVPGDPRRGRGAPRGRRRRERDRRRRAARGDGGQADAGRRRRGHGRRRGRVLPRAPGGLGDRRRRPRARSRGSRRPAFARGATDTIMTDDAKARGARPVRARPARVIGASRTA